MKTRLESYFPMLTKITRPEREPEDIALGSESMLHSDALLYFTGTTGKTMPQRQAWDEHELALR
jgi:hypothetical protein